MNLFLHDLVIKENYIRKKQVISLKTFDKRRLILISNTFIKVRKEGIINISLKPFQVQNLQMK